MSYYQITMTQGRSDTFTLESDSHTNLLTMMNTVSTAKVTNIKKIVFSKNLNVNYSKVLFTPVGHYNKVKIFCKSKSKAKVFELRFVKSNITESSLIRAFKDFVLIDNEEIIDVYSVKFF